MGRRVRRSARSKCRSDRLGRAIPLAETRNYVERSWKTLQVYRVRFGGSTSLLIEADLRRGAQATDTPKFLGDPPTIRRISLGMLHDRIFSRQPVSTPAAAKCSRTHAHERSHALTPLRGSVTISNRARWTAPASAALREAQQRRGAVVCLPGLARTVADFDTLAMALANDQIARGRSSRSTTAGAASPNTTAIPPITISGVELADVLAVYDRGLSSARGFHRQLARRHPRRCCWRPPAGGDRRRHPERHRAGDRTRRPDAHQRLCRRCRCRATLRTRHDPAAIVRRPISQTLPRRMAGRRAPHLRAETARWCRPTMPIREDDVRRSISRAPLPSLWKEFDALAGVAGDRRSAAPIPTS